MADLKQAAISGAITGGLCYAFMDSGSSDLFGVRMPFGAVVGITHAVSAYAAASFGLDKLAKSTINGF